jgi:hypothetical protein
LAALNAVVVKAKEFNGPHAAYIRRESILMHAPMSDEFISANRDINALGCHSRFCSLGGSRDDHDPAPDDVIAPA